MDGGGNGLPGGAALDRELDDEVAPGAVVVHPGVTDLPAPVDGLEERVKVRGALDPDLREALGDGSARRAVHELQASRAVQRQQVVQDLVVDLDRGDPDQELPAWGLVDEAEDVVAAVAHHGAHRVGLSAAGLPVGEDGAVVAVAGAPDQRLRGSLVDVGLCGARREGPVEGNGREAWLRGLGAAGGGHAEDS